MSDYRTSPLLEAKHSVLWVAAGLASLAALVPLAPSQTSFENPDEALLGVCWSVACGLAVWWTASLLLCMAANRTGSARLQRLCGAVAMPVARRFAQGTLALSLVALPACSTSETASPELVMIETGLPTTLPVSDVATATPTEAAPETTESTIYAIENTRTPEFFETDIFDRSTTQSLSNSEPDVAPDTRTADSHTVVGGDNMWSIAKAHVEQSGAPADSVANYWAKLVQANRQTLASGNPSLIYPGEVLVLPTA